MEQSHRAGLFFFLPTSSKRSQKEKTLVLDLLPGCERYQLSPGRVFHGLGPVSLGKQVPTVTPKPAKVHGWKPQALCPQQLLFLLGLHSLGGSRRVSTCISAAVGGDS